MTAYDRQMEELVRRIEACECHARTLSDLRSECDVPRIEALEARVGVKPATPAPDWQQDLGGRLEKNFTASELEFASRFNKMRDEQVATLVRAARHVRKLLLSREFEAACVADRCHLGPALEPFDQVAK